MTGHARLWRGFVAPVQLSLPLMLTTRLNLSLALAWVDVQINLRCKTLECTTLTRQMTDLRQEIADPASLRVLTAHAASAASSRSGCGALELIFSLQAVLVALAVLLHSSPALQDSMHENLQALAEWVLGADFRD